MSHTDHKCTSMKLYYFNVRVRGEVIRWMLHAGGCQFEDVRITQEEWPKHKPNMPLGQLPVLECEVDGKKHKLTQTATILQSVAHWNGLAPKKPEQAVQANEAFEVLREVAEAGYRAWFEPDAARKEKAMSEWKDNILCRNFAFLEKKIQANGGKFLAGGDSFSYADIAVACYLDSMRQWKNKDLDTEKFKTQMPGLYDLAHRVEAIPKLKEYLAKRPATDY